MSTSVLVMGTLHQWHSRVPTNDATSSHRLHSIERDIAKAFDQISVALNSLNSFQNDKGGSDVRGNILITTKRALELQDFQRASLSPPLPPLPPHLSPCFIHVLSCHQCIAF